MGDSYVGAERSIGWVAQLDNFPVQITGIQSTGQRIIVTDSQESVHFVRYRKAENQLVIFCDDTTPRYVTTCCVLDYNTVAVGDKFGSISILMDKVFHVKRRAAYRLKRL
ncbi:hypothetical protein OSTOST_25656 [Ostertagia ostertagi]